MVKKQTNKSNNPHPFFLINIYTISTEIQKRDHTDLFLSTDIYKNISIKKNQLTCILYCRHGNRGAFFLNVLESKHHIALPAQPEQTVPDIH